jgi:hypothetical protein
MGPFKKAYVLRDLVVLEPIIYSVQFFTVGRDITYHVWTQRSILNYDNNFLLSDTLKLRIILWKFVREQEYVVEDRQYWTPYEEKRFDTNIEGKKFKK